MSKPDEALAADAANAIAPRPTRQWRARLFQGYLVAATLAFAVLLVLARQADYFPIDLRITLAVQQFDAGWFNTLMAAVSYPGYAPQAWVIAAVIVVLLFAVGLRWEAVMAAAAGGGAAGLGALVKLAVHRPRPGVNLVQVAVQLDSYSFPSGHVILYTAFIGFLVFLTYTLFKPSAARAGLLAALAALVGLVGVSRIYLGNHWASDVTGAYLLGSLWLAACVSVYRWGKPRFFARQPLAAVG